MSNKPTDLQAKILDLLLGGGYIIHTVGTRQCRVEQRGKQPLYTCRNTLKRLHKKGWLRGNTVTAAGRVALGEDPTPTVRQREILEALSHPEAFLCYEQGGSKLFAVTRLFSDSCLFAQRKTIKKLYEAGWIDKAENGGKITLQGRAVLGASPPSELTVIHRDGPGNSGGVS